MSNMNIIIRICVYMHILTVEPSRARGLKHEVGAVGKARHRRALASSRVETRGAVFGCKKGCR